MMRQSYILMIWLCCAVQFCLADSPANNSERLIVGYYEGYAISNSGIGNRPPFSLNTFDPDLLTDLNVAFTGFGYVTKSIDPANPRLTGDYSIRPLDARDENTLYPQLRALKSRSKNGLRIFLSIGGWDFNDPNDPRGLGQYTHRLFSQMVSESTNRRQFIDSSIAYAHKHGFDGIDIDWEYPGDLRRGGTVKDFDNFVIFLKECYVALHAANPPLLLSYAAAPFVPYGIPKSFHDDPDSYFKWIAQCSQYLDRINVMTYDYHGPFDVPKVTGVNSPLLRDTNPGSTFYIAKTLQYYLSNGVPPQKIVLGLPTFGHSYAGVTGLAAGDAGPGKPFEAAGTAGGATKSPGFLAYFEIADLITQKKLTMGSDAVTSTAYGYNVEGREWVSFDTPETMKLKVQMALDRSLGGVMIWAINLDEYQWEPKFPNLRAVQATLRSGLKD